MQGAWWLSQLSIQLPLKVMISLFMGLSPVLGSVLTAQSLDPASYSVSVSLCPSPAGVLSLSLKNKHLKK